MGSMIILGVIIITGNGNTTILYQRALNVTATCDSIWHFPFHDNDMFDDVGFM